MNTQPIIEAINKKVREDVYGRKAITFKYPSLTPLVLGVRRFKNNLNLVLNKNISKEKNSVLFPHIIARHSSPLFRKLGDSNPKLQDGKIKNLRIAINALQGTIIQPGKIFSFWSVIGSPTKSKGYVNGMLLSRGKVIEGIGGGLCQLSNLLYWLFLHTSVEIVEREHHSRDVFPDSGRTIPFGAGATIFYNLIDLKIKNTSSHPIQINVWMSDTQLKGQICSTGTGNHKYHLYEKNHCFAKTINGIYRYNEIWKDTLTNGIVKNTEKIITNCAPVMYTPPRIDLFLDKSAS
jgi:vancomycin resistance protein VanW